MTTARVAGHDFDLSPDAVERALATLEAEPIHEHYVVVAGRRFPPKQVLAEITGLGRSDFTTRQAQAILRRLGFGVYRKGDRSTAADGTPDRAGPHGGAEAAALAEFRGRWVAQQDLEILFDADAPEKVLRWLRRHNRTARVWRVPASAAETGSALSAP